MENVKNAEELLDETVEVIENKKIASKALKEITKRVMEEAGGADKTNWNKTRKYYKDKGKGWVAGDPLCLDKEAKKKDPLSSKFKGLYDAIAAIEEFNMSPMLDDYFKALADKGITITIDSEKFAHADIGEESVNDALDSSKSYMETIDSYNDEIKDEHAPKSEELNFAPAGEYTGLVKIFMKGMKGKDVGDVVQDKVTYCEMTETAYNLVKDYIDANASVEDEE